MPARGIVETTAPAGITFRTETRGVHDGQTDMTLMAERDGKTAGYIDYVLYQDDIHVDMIEVYQPRRGIGTALAKKLQSEYPEAEIRWGFTTTAGGNFVEKLPRTYTPNEEFKRMSARLEAARRREAELVAQLDSTPGPHPNLSAIGEELNALSDEIWTLEKDLSQSKPGSWKINPGP